MNQILFLGIIYMLLQFFNINLCLAVRTLSYIFQAVDEMQI